MDTRALTWGEQKPGYGDLRAPELLAVRDVVPLSGEPGKFMFALDSSIANEIRFLLVCDASDFPFDSYCRFVRHPGQNHPYTFPSLEFHPDPPGLRLGPWPGWRGIPDFPEMSALCGPFTIDLQPTFWGDEISCGILRMLGRIPEALDESVTIICSDLRIIPRNVSIYATKALKARPLAARLLPAREGVHPRLLVTPELLPLLRDRAKGSHRSLWDRLLAVWSNRALPFEKTAESKCLPGPERLSGQDRVLISALIALVSEDSNNILEALQAYSAYLDETGHPDYEPLGIDTQAGEALFVLSVGYDWLMRWMPEVERKRAWERMEQFGAVCSSYLTPERVDYGQAHYLGCGLGLLAFSFLRSDVESDSSNRLAELRGALECALSLLSDDGSYPHGINLWIYEFGFLLRWLELFRGCGGDDFWLSHGEALDRASAFRAATLSSDTRHGVTFGDPQYRVGGDSWCHFLIASRTGSEQAQWLGERLVDQPHDGVDFRNIPARRRVYEFLFFDPEVGRKAAATAVQAFPGSGQVTVRSSGTLFTMRSGPPLGRKRYAAGEYGAYGHSDPANGSFLLEQDGQLIVSGPGPVYRRDTSLHNVITIDGKGQIGDSSVWLPDFFPPEVLLPSLEIGPEGQSAVLFADLTKAYLPHLGVKRCTRTVFVDPARAVVGADTVACGEVRSIEWNMHSWFPFDKVSTQWPIAFDLGRRTRLVILSPGEAIWETGLTEFIPAYPNDGKRDHRCVGRVRSREVRFVWCLLLDSALVPRLQSDESGSFRIEFEDGFELHSDGCRFQPRGKS
jgi:hypothetical protein